MGFAEQEKSYSCGAASIKYALTVIGLKVKEKELRHRTRTTRADGADENKLLKALSHFGCRGTLRNFRDFEIAFRVLRRYTARDIPCVLSVDNDDHWIAAVAFWQGKIGVLDPAKGEKPGFISPRTLKRRWGAAPERDDRRGQPHYFMIAVRHRRRREIIGARLGPEEMARLRRNMELRKNWNDYREDLEDIFGARPSRSKKARPAWKFIRDNSDLIAGVVSFWHGWANKHSVARQLRDFQTVAKSLGLTLPPEKRDWALNSLVAAITLNLVGD